MKPMNENPLVKRKRATRKLVAAETNQTNPESNFHTDFPQNNNINTNKMNTIKLVGIGIVTIVLTIVTLLMVEFHTVRGGFNSIKETWTGGGFSQEMYDYDMTLKTYEITEYKIRSSDNQEMTIKSKVQWRRDASKLVQHHKMFKQNAEQVAINPAMISAILRHGTQYKAIDAYSGEGLIKMQSDISNDLLANAQLKNDGIIIESFIIEHNHLNPEYLEQINARQLATLKQSRAEEERKAADAQALVAKSLAQSDLNKAVVEAQRDKEVMVLKAEAENEKAVLAAKAESQKLSIEAEGQKSKLIAEADGKRQAAIAEAEGLLALGKAKAESQKLQLQAYAVPGAEAFTKIEISKNMGVAFSGLKGWLPSDMKLNILADNFDKSLDVVSGNVVVPVKK